MKLSVLIENLQYILATHGELPVYGAHDGRETPGIGVAVNESWKWTVEPGKPRADELPKRVTIES